MMTDDYPGDVDRETYQELFTVGQGFVHVLDEPLLRRPDQDRVRRLKLTALAVWAVAGVCLAVLALVLSATMVDRGDAVIAPEEHVLSMPLPGLGGPAASAEAHTIAGLQGLAICGGSEPTCDDPADVFSIR